MLFAAAGLLFIAFIALAFVGIKEARVGVRQFEHELDARALETARARDTDHEFASREAEQLAEARFSSSLLSLSKAHLQAQRDSQEPVLDESSSLVSVPLSQSKSPVRRP